jgi:thiol:disulfide interchange protein DsbD
MLLRRTNNNSSPPFSMLRFLSALLIACTVLLAPARADEDFLPPEQAFKFSARMLDPHTVQVNYAIADGYYMYRERFKFAAAGATLGEALIPPGKIKFDDTFQKNVETYHHAVAIRIPVQGEGPFTLTVTGQGCADKGLCYPPQDASIRLVAGSGAGGGQSQPQMSLPSGQSGAAGLGATPAAEGAPRFTLPGQPVPSAASQPDAAASPPAAGAQPADAGAVSTAAPAVAPAAGASSPAPAAPSDLSGCRAAACSPSCRRLSCSASRSRSRHACCRWCRSCPRSSSAKARKPAAGAVSSCRSPIRSVWRPCTPSSASPPGSRAKAWRLRFRIHGCCRRSPC